MPETAAANSYILSEFSMPAIPEVSTYQSKDDRPVIPAQLPVYSTIRDTHSDGKNGDYDANNVGNREYSRIITCGPMASRGREVFGS